MTAARGWAVSAHGEMPEADPFAETQIDLCPTVAARSGC
jgi:hypothetical protein